MKSLRFLFLITLIIIFASIACEKEDKTEKKQYLKSINLLSKEIMRFFYDSSSRLTRIEIRHDLSSPLDAYYYSKYDLYYKENGKLDRFVERALDTTFTSPTNGTSQIHIPGTVSTAHYNSENNFCGLGSIASTYTLEFSSEKRMISKKSIDREEYFEYDDLGNLTEFSYYYQGSFYESWVHEYDTKKNPYFNYYPFWGLGESNWPFPISKSYAFLSPNNPTKLTLTEWTSVHVYYFKYLYNEMGYPVQCTYQRQGESDFTITFIYY